MHLRKTLLLRLSVIGRSHYLHADMTWIQLPSCFGIIKSLCD